MSSLYNKYRPKKLKDIVGNDSVVSSISGMFKKKQVPHAFLFHGQSGTGKTTMARIIAKKLGAHKSEIYEIDAAQARGIDTVRDITSKCKHAPLYGDVKVYIMDEFHQGTKDAQNGILKVLEDTPDHVYFFLCTTDPQKLLGTIRTRCSDFQMSLLDDEEMSGLIKDVASKEKDKLEKKVINQIVDDGLGSPRLALQILQKVLSVEPKKRLALAKQVAEEQSEVIALCRVLMEQKPAWAKINKILRGIKTQDPETIRRGVVWYCTNTLLKNNHAKAGLVLDCFIEPFFHTGFPQVVHACYSVSMG